MVAELIGGIGLFLIGMLLLTDGLQSVAGEALRSILQRFTRTRMTSVISGFAVTAAVQSSTITSLLVLGFVGAELLTFSSAIAVIYGAAIGTTTMSWLVATVGLKFNISAFAMPMIGVGAMMRLFLKGRLASIGMAIAGFGLIFFGIHVLQGGMADLANTIDLTRFEANTLGGRLILVAVGLAISITLQSSGAAMATNLTALFSGAIGIEQAAALTVGMAVSTITTTALSAVGASTQAKRTAMAHILIHLSVGVVGFIQLPGFLYLLSRVAPDATPGDQAIYLTAFFTTFKLTTVILFYPVTDQFAALIKRALPDRGIFLTRRLNESSLATPSIALEAAHATITDITQQLLTVTHQLLTSQTAFERITDDLIAIQKAIDQTRSFMQSVHSDPTNTEQYARHISVLHILDHDQRMLTAISERNFHTLYLQSPEMHPGGHKLADVFTQLQTAPHLPLSSVEPLRELSLEIAAERRQQRQLILQAAAQGKIDPEHAVAFLEAKRWLDRIAYHAWRAMTHLVGAAAKPTDSERPPPESEIPSGMPEHQDQPLRTPSTELSQPPIVNRHP